METSLNQWWLLQLHLFDGIFKELIKNLFHFHPGRELQVMVHRIVVFGREFKALRLSFFCLFVPLQSNDKTNIELDVHALLNEMSLVFRNDQTSAVLNEHWFFCDAAQVWKLFPHS